jgi:ABC-2 type transport system permease protein
MILAGMLLSNLIEEKSNKVIEVLAAAVPVDAIFLGKLIAMLGMSLTGIAVWGSTATIAILAFAHGAAGLPPPAVGWPAFVALGVGYFTASYLLLGAAFLGIGAQANSVREVQTMSMPVTMGQLVVFAFASSAVSDPNGTTALAATVFPWSSPFAMLARAAQIPAIWPHLVALVWQALWIALIIRFASRRFRISVLKSGSVKRRLFARAGVKKSARLTT